MSQRKEERKHKMRLFIALLIVLLVVVSFVFLCYKTPLGDFIKSKIGKQEEKPAGVVSEIPEFDDVPYVVPYFLI